MLGWLRRPRPTAIEPVPEVVPGELSVTFGGHATALHLSGPETAAAMTDWIKGHVSAH